MKKAEKKAVLTILELLDLYKDTTFPPEREEEVEEEVMDLAREHLSLANIKKTKQELEFLFSERYVPMGVRGTLFERPYVPGKYLKTPR